MVLRLVSDFLNEDLIQPDQSQSLDIYLIMIMALSKYGRMCHTYI